MNKKTKEMIKTCVNMLPFTVPNDYFVELRSFKKKIPKYKGWRTSRRFKPFISPTAIETRKYPNGKYLFVLDFDYPEKWDNKIYQQFKYKDTYTRESNHGLHLYYWSTQPREIVQRKKVNNDTVCNVDFKGLTRNAEITGDRGGYVVYYDRPANNLPLMEIDCNILIKELYKLTGVPITYYNDKKIYTKNPKGQYVIKNSEIQPYHVAIAKYLKTLNSDWSHGYDLSFILGLKLGGVLDDEIEAEAIATALMNNTIYPHKRNWIINFCNGYLCSDNRKFTNIGSWRFKYPELVKMKYKLNEYEFIDLKEFVDDFKLLKLEQFIKLTREVKIWENI